MPFLGNQPVEGYKTVAKQTITGTGATVYTLDYKVTTASELEVSVNNVRQEPEVAYTVSGNQITFTTAVESSDDCYVVFHGRAVTSNLIESQNIADGVITAAKLAEGAVTDPTPAAVSDQANTSTGFFALPRGTTAQRPGSPQDGYVRYNTTIAATEEYRNGVWRSLSSVFAATGGTESEAGGYKRHVFTTSGQFEVTAGQSTVDVVIVAGGGGGGSHIGGGAGGGGFIAQQVSVVSGTYSIVVGAGGAGGTTNGQGNAHGVNGVNTTAFSLTAIGGGAGGDGYANGLSGGSGGGSGHGNGVGYGGSGTSGQGNAGGGGFQSGPHGAGAGGGAGGVGETATSGDPVAHGGVGRLDTILGSNYYWAGGGGGGGYQAAGGNGGIGGGGGGSTQDQDGNGDQGGSGGGSALNSGANGGRGSGVAGGAGGANTGGGGGGGAHVTGYGGQGGSGIVIIRYAI